MKFIRKHAYAFFFGGTFSWLTDYYLNDWEWWVFTVILIFLVQLRDLDKN